MLPICWGGVIHTQTAVPGRVAFDHWLHGGNREPPALAAGAD